MYTPALAASPGTRVACAGLLSLSFPPTWRRAGVTICQVLGCEMHPSGRGRPSPQPTRSGQRGH